MIEDSVYELQIRAHNKAGWGAWSVRVTTKTKKSAGGDDSDGDANKSFDYRPRSYLELDSAGHRLGVNVLSHPEYMGLAADWIDAPLPVDYVECSLEKDTKTYKYFWNNTTRQSQWEHPGDKMYRQATFFCMKKNGVTVDTAEDNTMLTADVEPLIEPYPDFPSPDEMLHPVKNPNAERAYKFEPVLWLQVHSAKDLGAADSNGTSDPYAIIFWGGKEIAETKTEYGNLDPVWMNEVFDLVFPDTEEQNEFEGTEAEHAHHMAEEALNDLRVEVYDHDEFGRGDFLGEICISGPELLSMIAESPKHSRVEMTLNKKPHMGRQRLVKGSLTLSFTFGQRKPPPVQIHHYPFQILTQEMPDEQRTKENVTPESLQLICNELGFSPAKECTCMQVVAEYLDRVISAANLNKPLWDKSWRSERLDGKWAQVKIDSHGTIFTAEEVADVDPSINLKDIWYNDMTEQQLDVHPLIHELRAKIHKVRAREILTNHHLLGRWVERWFAFGDEEDDEVTFYNFSEGKFSQSPPLIFMKATSQTQRTIRGFLGRRKFLKHQFNKNVVKEEAENKKRTKQLAALSAERRLEEEARIAEEQQEKIDKDNRRKQVEAQRRAMKYEMINMETMATQERWQKAYGDRFWGQDIAAVMNAKKKEKFDLAEKQRLEDERKAAEEAEIQRIEDEKQRRLLEHQKSLEAKESECMREEYRLQTCRDSFWGLDKEVSDQQQSLKDMAEHDRQSRLYLEELQMSELHQEWMEISRKREEQEALEARVEEAKAREQYIREFWAANDSGFVIKHKGLTTPQGEDTPEDDSSVSYASVTGYDMAAVYDAKRVTAPGTVHNYNPLATSGKRAPLETFATKSCFDLKEDPYGSHEKKWSFNPRRAIDPIPGQTADQTMVQGQVGLLRLRSSNERKGRTNQELADSKLRAKTAKMDAKEERNLITLFNCVDLDNSGKIERNEFLQAMKLDQEVREMVQNSKILRPLLKKKTFKSHFLKMDVSGNGMISLEEFLQFCRVQAAALEESGDATRVPVQGHKYARKRTSIEEARVLRNTQDHYRSDQTHKLTQMFRMIDKDNSGLLDQRELLTALKDDDAVSSFAKQCHALKPLLSNKLFAESWRAMDTDDDGGVSLEEFIEFCLVIKEVSDLNHM